MRELEELYREKLGVDCVPGSLNVELGEPYDLPLGGPRIEAGKQGCPVGVSFAACRLAGLDGFVVRTDANAAGRGDHPRTIVELVAPVHFREALGLEDGDEVSLELPRPS
jgi:riboflavin kinase